ncbi:L-fucose kinase isoform X2 [Hyperolius riggenbachi]|uniref:L-fucose kinase isoform X2 n=1 Tax=Hyperolius riggenbachi TaxID=752182 RepID=UPI0035A30CDF
MLRGCRWKTGGDRSCGEDHKWLLGAGGSPRIEARMGSHTDWSVLVLTCQHKDSVQAFQKELEIRQRRGLLPRDTLLLTVEDPQAHVGSGGATLNALLVAAEHLSARAGYTVVSSDVLQGARLLILHTGRDFLFDDCGRAFTILPLEDQDDAVESVTCNLDSLLTMLRYQLCPGSPPGVWICSTDMMLSLPSSPRIDWSQFRGARVISLPGTPEYARSHGVYLMDKQGTVKDIIYRGSEERIRACLLEDQHVPLVSGIVFLSSEATERFLHTLATPPLDGCTYQGLDSGAEPLQISLFLDVLMSMCQNVTEEKFLDGSPGLTDRTRSARALLWKELHGLPLSIVYIPDGRYEYLSLKAHDHISNLVRAASHGASGRKMVHSFVTHPDLIEEGSCVMNSLLRGEVSVCQGSVVQHCHLQGSLHVDSGCLLTGIDHTGAVELRGHHLSDVILQAHHVHIQNLSLTVYSLLGSNDDLQCPAEGGSPTYLNVPWEEFFHRTGISESELRGSDAGSGQRSVLTAPLFPVLHPSESLGVGDVLWFLSSATPGSEHERRRQRWRSSWRMSWQQIQQYQDQERALQARRELFFSQGVEKVQRILLGREERSLMPIIRAAVQEGAYQRLLSTLDTVASVTVDAGVAARALACVADVLGCMADGEGGLRSGPAANKAWAPAYLLLEKGDISQGVTLLAEERKKWLSRPALLLRAARHYEGAEQILIRRAVMSSFQFVSIGEQKPPPQGQWVTAECPARIDMSGGWSDTPPITYEHGGAVVNIAILVDDQRPIGARARRIAEPQLRLSSNSGPRGMDLQTQLTCSSVADLQDYCQPQAPGALLKAAFICSGTVELTSGKPLSEQLTEKYGGGFELQTWSYLPHGSGLGTSSILAGAVMAALYEASGRSADAESLIHAVLHLEQVLTTGGGWQDQVGGLIPGVKVGRSAPALPLHVTVERIELPERFVETLNKHLLLVYTGKTRLARNLLQDVLRNWYARLPDIMQNVDGLVSNAELCAQAFRTGDMQLLGHCLSTYWQQKKCMAPGCEPLAVRRIMDTLEPHVYGQSLAGAGGGGFLYVLTKEAEQKGIIQSLLENTQGLERCSVHSVQLDLQTFSVHQGPAD